MFAAALLLSQPLQAQTVRVRGYGEADVHSRIRAALASNARILTRDTTIAAGDTVRSDVLVLGSRLILEGAIVGDLIGVQANMYLRPPATVTGKVTNVAGGLYPSELATMGSVEDRALAPYRLVRSGDDYVVEGTVKLPAVRWLGGTRIPEYNRVDGLRVELGPRILLPPVAGLEPIITGSIGYATEREDVLGRAELMFRRGRSSLAGGWEENITLTNDEWIRSPTTNSLSVLWNGKDYRDYYEARRVYVEFRRVLERGTRVSEYWVRGQREDSRPLLPGDPFTILEPDSIRSNLLVDSLRLTSLMVGLDAEHDGALTVWNFSGWLEFAGKALDADRTFNAYNTFLKYAMKAIADHTLQVELDFRGPLPGTEDLPLQRWTFVGGSGTLYTFEVAEFRGDRLAFIETEYRIPFRRTLRAPIIGRPTLRLMHNIGMAWSRLDDRSFEQNVGVRLQFPLVFARVVTDPRHFTDDVKFTVGISTPTRGYPWEKPKRRD